MKATITKPTAPTTTEVAAIDPRRITGLKDWLPQSSESERAAMLAIILAADSGSTWSEGPQVDSKIIWHAVRDEPVAEGLTFDEIVSRPQARSERLGSNYIEQVLRAVAELRAKRAELEQQLAAIAFFDSVSHPTAN